MTTEYGKQYELLSKITSQVSRVVIGKEDIKELLLLALLSQGHVLIEGFPGTAKTTIARTFAQVIGGKFKRVQGTPDMLPSDILGFYHYRPDGSATFMPGPIFANVILADDVKGLLVPSLSHRLRITAEAEMDKVTPEAVIKRVASEVPVPKEGAVT